MLGTIVNAVAVIIGSFIGLLVGRALPTRIGENVMKALGLCILYIGISGALKGSNTLVLIISIVIGTIIGEALDLDGLLIKLGERVEARLGGKLSAVSATGDPGGSRGGKIAQGFVTASLMFCVGAMSIVGSLQSGLTGDHTTIFIKSALDFTSSIIFASQLGIGVALSSVFIITYQGSIVLLSHWIAPLLSEAVIAEMTCAGSVIIIGIALNMLGITKLKVMNFVPAIFVAAVAQVIYSLI
ncbi:MAG TPA: DUF554 domain-containing protein [Clostridiales bacterium]|nr:DUF554 domain-containing protein [Clostridiales bacterium]